jgi:Ca2+-binding RTX toxin-like protein
MAIKAANTPLNNDITKAVEGTTKWGVNSLTYAFAAASDAATVNAYLSTIGNPGTFTPVDTNAADGLTDRYQSSVLAALAEYSRVANLTFTAASTFAAADLKITLNSFTGAGFTTTAGRMDFPGTNPKGSSTTDFESFVLYKSTGFWVTQGTETGGSNFRMNLVLHELGHGLGLGHPHDTGNGTTTLGGLAVDSSGLTLTGDDPLDNERYTEMSYERGGIDSNFGRDFGHIASPAPIDIAALQHMYGANATTNSGNTTYTLLDKGAGATDTDGSDGAVQVGRAFFTIWDTSGSADILQYNGSNRAYLNLNDASLSRTDDADTKAWISALEGTDTYTGLPDEIRQDIDNAKFHAGGFISHVFDTTGHVDLGGLAIAKGGASNAIENAKGGSGDDVIVGDEFANEITGNGGKDLLLGGSGNDRLNGNAGDDQLIGGSGNDTLDGGDGKDTAYYSGACDDYDMTRNPKTGAITIVHARGDKTDGTDTLTNVEVAHFKDGDVDLTKDPLDCGPIDFILLVDLSGSFADDLPSLKASAKSIADSVMARDPNARFALASFVDKPVAPYGAPGDYLYKPELSLTADVGSFQNAVNRLTIFNGGDTPEAQFVGLWEAAHGVGLDLRPDSRKVIMIATDAPSHSAADYGLNESTIKAFLESAGVTVTSHAAEAAAGDALLTAGLGGEIPVQPGSGDTGTGADPGSPDGDALLSALKLMFDTTGATPIFAVTSDVKSTYSGYQSSFERGAPVTLDFDSANIADALRLALAEINNELTQAGTDGDDTLIGTDPVADVLYGGPGKDFIDGRGSDDILDGGNGNDTVLGRAGNDQINTGSGDDRADGGPGDDTLDGGPGTDTAVFSGPRSAYTFAQSGTSLVVKGPDGTDRLSNFEFLAFSDGTIAAPSAPRIGSNGGGDTASLSIPENIATVTTVTATDADAGTTLTYSISGGADAALFQINASTGALSFISAPNFEQPADADHNNSYIVQVRASDGSLFDDQAITVNVTDVPETVHWMASIDVGVHPAGYAISGIGDFNHDGTKDVLWYNPATRDTDIWSLSNGHWAGSSTIGVHPAGYDIAGIGDFNNDGTGDVLWYNPATRDTDIWTLNNGHWAGSTTIGVHPAGYQIAGIGDFNHDGTSDVLWFNPATNDTDIWLVSNGHWMASTTIGVHPAGYQVAGIGDFNHDGTSDVLWVNPVTNDTDIWLLNNGHWAGSTTIGVHPAGYQVVGIGDFNQDGTSDVVWSGSSSNDIDVWLVNNGHWAGSAAIGSHAPGWSPLVGDFDHNGTGDILWRETATNHVETWLTAYS